MELLTHAVIECHHWMFQFQKKVRTCSFDNLELGAEDVFVYELGAPTITLKAD